MSESFKVVGKSHPRIFPSTDDKPLNQWVLRKAISDDVKDSNQGLNVGDRFPAFNFEALLKMRTQNVHHSACIDAKVNSSVGMGFDLPAEFKKRKQDAALSGEQIPEEPESKAEAALNPLCSISFMDVLKDMAEDYVTTGNGTWEVVREAPRPDAPIAGIYHLPICETNVFVEEHGSKHYHYKINSTEGARAAADMRFARFGDLERFLKKYPRDNVSEVIHFRRSSSLDKFYGVPDWIAGVASIELVQAITQHNFDFFMNRGVPEFMLFLTGANIDEKEWEKIGKAMEATIGQGNQHKSLAVRIAGGDAKVQLEKLALDGKTNDMFSDISDTLALQIVSAHRVPALLAGIQLPGKMAATNELPNALAAFQLLTIGPEQKNIETILNCTLGNPKYNGGLSLGVGDFKFRKITDELNLDNMDTMSRMKESVPEAQASGRKVEDGLKKIFKDAGVEDTEAGAMAIKLMMTMAYKALAA